MIKTTEWSHLPNAAHIDQVLSSLQSHPKVWASAGDATRLAVRDTAVYAAWWATRLADRWEARYAARNAAEDTTWDTILAADASRDAARLAARLAAHDAIAALIAWDDCAPYLDMTSDQLEVWAILSKEPAAVLLLPAVTAFEMINELELV